MSENENKVCPVSCKIEHHAMMFAFLAKHAIELCGEAGKDAILAGMTTYGNERGARMAACRKELSATVSPILWEPWLEVCPLLHTVRMWELLLLQR